jgi:hypothetical protein|tara:strand:- start:1542 stop:1886 length:345 start_codon:yes stop_codon:yes gene_type:complete
MAERRINMGFWAKFIAFITPPPTEKKVDEVMKAKVIKSAVQTATVTLDKFDDASVVKAKPKRARTKKGTYKADDKSTPDVNEAWVGGKAPTKKKKTTTKTKKPKAKTVKVTKKK